MTQKEAIELSIKKWEWIVDNGGSYSVTELIGKFPGLEDFHNGCPLCELYYETSEGKKKRCAECPLAEKYKRIYKDNCGCHMKSHPFNKWCMTYSKEDAQKVLDMLKNIK